MGRTSSYPAEFRSEAVRLVLHTDKSAAQVARDLGISPETPSTGCAPNATGSATRPDHGQRATCCAWPSSTTSKAFTTRTQRRLGYRSPADYEGIGAVA